MMGEKQPTFSCFMWKYYYTQEAGIAHGTSQHFKLQQTVCRPSLGSYFAVCYFNWVSSPSHTHTLGPPGPTTSGVVYTRWGKTTCPNTTGTQLLYAGRAAGSDHRERGGGANHLCLPERPQYSTYTAGTQSGRAYLYGVEYQTGAGYANSPLISVHDHNVPCAVCYTSTRETVVMIPARLTCPSSWTREYYGYLMTEKHDHHRSTFECVDQSPQSVPGSAPNTNGVLFYHTEVKCNGIPCPPYDTQKEVMCVVCTKWLEN